MDFARVIDDLARELAKTEITMNQGIFNDNPDQHEAKTVDVYVANMMETSLHFVLEGVADHLRELFRKHYKKLAKEQYPQLTAKEFGE